MGLVPPTGTFRPGCPVKTGIVGAVKLGSTRGSDRTAAAALPPLPLLRWTPLPRTAPLPHTWVLPPRSSSEDSSTDITVTCINVPQPVTHYTHTQMYQTQTHTTSHAHSISAQNTNNRWFCHTPCHAHSQNHCFQSNEMRPKWPASHNSTRWILTQKRKQMSHTSAACSQPASPLSHSWTATLRCLWRVTSVATFCQ